MRRSSGDSGSPPAHAVLLRTRVDGVRDTAGGPPPTEPPTTIADERRPRRHERSPGTQLLSTSVSSGSFPVPIADGKKAARARLEQLRSRLSGPLPEERFFHGDEMRKTVPSECSFTEAQFLEAVRRCKEYILAGDVMQVQVSQRTSRARSTSPTTGQSISRASRSTSR